MRNLSWQGEKFIDGEIEARKVIEWTFDSLDNIARNATILQIFIYIWSVQKKECIKCVQTKANCNLTFKSIQIYKITN